MLTLKRTLRATLFLSVLLGGAAHAADLDPKAITIQLPENIQWGPVNANGTQVAPIIGDQSKPGFYVLLARWKEGNFSKPHTHENDRYITVISGTWWVGTGDKWETEKAVPVPAGSVVTHYGKQVHWDGAQAGKGDAVILVVGMGPGSK
jgi:quercetin dioxygenase-like cupin family protein